MRVVVYGASGMVGQGVLRECLRAADVERVVSVVRAPSGAPERSDAKLDEVVVADVAAVPDDKLRGLDACFFCLGVSSAGMSEADYRRVTYDLTLAVARTLVRLNPKMTFVYVSGAGTDSTEKGRSMWARVKGATENAIIALGFGGAYMFRPGAIRALGGIRPKSRTYRVAYAIFGWLLPLVEKLAPNAVTTTEKVGLAMLAVARRGHDQRFIGNAEINALAAG